jgi:PAS domain S-box-containing protein
MGFYDRLTDTSGLAPPGFCLTWKPGLSWLDAGSDLVMMAAFFSVPLAIVWFVRRRADLPHRWVAWLFAAFVAACGSTHGMALLTLWVPAYAAAAMVKLAAAGLSAVAAAGLWVLAPKLLLIPSPGHVAGLNKELMAALASQTETTASLEDRECELRQAQDVLRRANEDLEQHVADRTAGLREMNETLCKNEARFRNVVEAVPNGIVMVSRSGRIEMVNAQAERMFGYDRSEVLGRPLDMLLPAGVRPRHGALVAGFFTRSLARPIGAVQGLSARRKDGGAFQVEIGLNPIETEDGPMVLSAIVDVSDRVRLEAQLRQSQKLEAVGRLTAGVAHDFNNLLQVLGGGLELVIDEVADRPAAVEYAQIAQRAALRGRDLTSRLLAFSRQQVLVPRPVPVDRLLDDLQALVGHLLDGRGELLIVRGAPNAAVLADESQLEAAIINLSVNARDAMPDGGRLRIAAFEADADPTLTMPPGRYLVISVSDTGKGMDEATLARACEPFFTTKGLDGAGLGLSMVHGFARQSGGDVRIASTPGVGTTVEIWLPASGDPAAAPPAEQRRESTRGRVLLVDDAPDVLLTVGAFLRNAGLDVTRAETGDLALKKLMAGQRFDIVITDFAMPGLNGLDLLLQARELDPELIGIVITGFHDPVMLRGVANIVVMHKPFSRNELVERVGSLLKLAQRA